MSNTTVASSSGRGRSLTQGLWPWLVMGVIFLGAPWVFDSGASLSVMSLMGIGIVFALSYNMLFGQTGLLSFGHAVYYGLGAYFTMHALNYCVATGLPFPVELLPLVGGLTGLVFGLVLGFISTRRAGVTFAMISLGIGVLAASLAVILRQFFGGDGGLSGDPTLGAHLFGITLASRLQIYYFVAAWCALSTVVMYLYTKTPLGQMANAVRDNPERVQFIGFNPHQVRFRVHTLAGMFAGIAGGMAAIADGIVSPDSLGFVNSGEVLMMAYIGGAAIFFGPIVGAVIITWMTVLLSNYTDAWQLYIGLFFVLVIMYIPGGVASLIQMHIPPLRHRQFHRLIPAYLLILVPGAIFVLGLLFIVQMSYQLHSVHIFLDQAFTFFGFEFDVHNPWTWGIAIAVTLGALWACQPAAGYVRRAWDRVAQSIEGDRRPEATASGQPR